MPIIREINQSNNDSNMDDNETGAKKAIFKVFEDISKTSATKQIIIGASSGWITGYLAMKVGKSVACAIGGGIILLEIANEKGYIKINWDKVNKQVDKVSDGVEKSVTGQGPSWTDKMERYVDRKVDKAEKVLKEGPGKAGKWFSSIGTNNSKFKVKEIHIFIVSFVAGITIGIATS